MSIIRLLSLLILAIALTGCSNTIAGFGKDMQQLGTTISNSAK
ncbi:MAG TPA: entericidin A/B family lipoprotein [Burkholderiales bacterium]|nr:entericidin A/B family lipoprotein [Burkholderiales bacterium]